MEEITANPQFGWITYGSDGPEDYSVDAEAHTPPGHTDLMVSPESIDAFLEQNPPPVPNPDIYHDPLNGAGGILQEALEIVTGARQVTHGEKERSFQVIGDLWTAYLEGRNTHDKGVTAFDVAQMMVLLKIARSIQGTRHRDHFVDAAGYAAIAGELA